MRGSYVLRRERPRTGNEMRAWSWDKVFHFSRNQGEEEVALHLVDQSFRNARTKGVGNAPGLRRGWRQVRGGGPGPSGGWAGGRRAAGGLVAAHPALLPPSPAVGGRCLLPGCRGSGGRAAGGAASSGTAGGAAGRAAGAARAGAASGAADGESGRGRRRRLLVGPGTAGRGLCVRRRRRWCSGPAEPGKRGRAERCSWPRPDPVPSFLSLSLGSFLPAPPLGRTLPPRPRAHLGPPPIPRLPADPAPLLPPAVAGESPLFGEGRCARCPQMECPSPIQRPFSRIRPSSGETAEPRDCWGAFLEVPNLSPSDPPLRLASVPIC